MPAMGPNQDHAYQQAQQAFQEVLLLLKDKYHVARPISPLKSLQEKWGQEWDTQNEKLLEALKEMFWLDACSSF